MQTEPAASNGDDAKAAPATSSSKTLMDTIVETVAKCSEECDDVVHVQVIKLLLMTLTSKNCEVHEASLLLAVRSCFHIHLISKNPVNKTTAKAALTQIMSVVFNRMEARDAELQSTDEDYGSKEVDVAVSPLVVSALGLKANRDETVAADEEKESVSDEKAGGVDAGDTTDSTTDTKADPSKPVEVFPSVLHKDAFLIFRALCKLSMKGLQDETGGSPSDPIALQNK